MIPRLYIDLPITAGSALPLTTEQVHYLRNVLRRAEGDPLRVFNGRDGEFSARIGELKKRGGIAVADVQLRPQQSEPDLTLYFAPVKRGPLEMILQKGTEIGVAGFVPVITERTNAPKLNIERLQSIATEAAEQCERMNVPTIHQPIKLASLISDWDTERQLLFCDEAGDDAEKEWGGEKGRAQPILEALTQLDSKTESWGVLTGPEGGFTPEERQSLREQSFVIPATLGPRILRADTAAIAALTLWQAALGDWRTR